MLQRDEIREETAFQRVAMGTDHHDLLGRQRIQRELDFGDEGEGSLASGQQLAQVQGLDGLVDRIAAAAALQGAVGEVLLDPLPEGGVGRPAFQLAKDGVEQRALLPVAGLPETGRIEIGSVGKHALAGQDMMPRTSIDQRMRAAGIVPEHSPDATAVARRRFRAEEQAIRTQGDVQFVPNHAGLHPHPPLFRIDFQDFVPTPDIHNDAFSHDLSGQRRARSAGNQTGSAASRLAHQFLDVGLVLRIRDAGGNLPIRRRIRRICQLMQPVGMDDHAHAAAQSRLKMSRV